MKQIRSPRLHQRAAFLDTTPYGSGKDDSISVSDATENAAITRHTITIGEKAIGYTARAGHLVTIDEYSAQPAAKIFYVAFTADYDNPKKRPVTFFYNGGPGSSSVFLLLGSFGPRRIQTNMPDFTPPPYDLQHNQDSLLDHTDLVFINPVGTGYSAAIAPRTNKDFWGVDEDARCIKQFIKRYLTVFDRWNSPKYLFGESYGTPRTCVLTWLLHEDGVDLNGIILQSAILDYSQRGNPVGLLPTLAADAFAHKKVTPQPPPDGLPDFMDKVTEFAWNQYVVAKTRYALTGKIDDDVLQSLSDILGVSKELLRQWKLDPATGEGTTFLTSLLRDEGRAVGAYDGRVTADDAGIAGSISPDSGANDPTMTAVGGVYTAMWNVYLNDELQFTATSPFTDLNDQAFRNWNFDHIDPTGEQKGGSGLYTVGDLAGSIALNPSLKVFCANGYYDAVTPFFQTLLDLKNMPLNHDDPALDNLTIRNYESGHMIYLDDKSRTLMKRDLADFYKPAAAEEALLAPVAPGEPPWHISNSRYRRRLSRTPY